MIKKLFGKIKEGKQKDNQVRIVLPEDSYSILEWDQEGLPCICVLNTALKNFEHKKIFGWHLSVIIDFEDIVDNGMPSEEEREIVDPFCDQLEEDIKAGGNALFLVRETWNKTRRLVWRVYNPDIADQHLKYIIDNHKNIRPFDYRMVQDLEWEQVEWYSKLLKK